MTLEVFRMDGNVLTSKDLLIRDAIGVEILSLRSLRTLAGMLWGPDDLDWENEPMILETSSGATGERNIEICYDYVTFSYEECSVESSIVWSTLMSTTYRRSYRPNYLA